MEMVIGLSDFSVLITSITTFDRGIDKECDKGIDTVIDNGMLWYV